MGVGKTIAFRAGVAIGAVGAVDTSDAPLTIHTNRAIGTVFTVATANGKNRVATGSAIRAAFQVRRLNATGIVQANRATGAVRTVKTIARVNASLAADTFYAGRATGTVPAKLALDAGCTTRTPGALAIRITICATRTVGAANAIRTFGDRLERYGVKKCTFCDRHRQQFSFGHDLKTPISLEGDSCLEATRDFNQRSMRLCAVTDGCLVSFVTTGVVMWKSLAFW